MLFVDCRKNADRLKFLVDAVTFNIALIQLGVTNLIISPPTLDERVSLTLAAGLREQIV